MSIIRDENLNCRMLILGPRENSDLEPKELLFIKNLTARLATAEINVKNGFRGDILSRELKNDNPLRDDFRYYDLTLEFRKTSAKKSKKLGISKKCLAVETTDKKLLSVAADISKSINKIILNSDSSFVITRDEGNKKNSPILMRPNENMRIITIYILNDYTDIDAMVADPKLYDELCESILNILISHRA